MSENKTLILRSHLVRDKASGVLAFVAVFFVFLFPLKFGMMTGVPEVASALPPTLFTLVIMFWPPLFFSFLSSLLLLGVLLFIPPPAESERRALLIPGAWLLLFLSVLPGVINASMMDFSVIQISLFAGYASFSLALFRILSVRPDLKIWFINAIVASAVITLFISLSQYLYGFQSTLDYMYRQEAESGCKISPQMMSRLLQKRLFSPFSICNSLGAHIILTLPVVIWGVLNSKVVLKTVVIIAGITLLLFATPPATSDVSFFVLAFIVCFGVSLLLLRFPDQKYRSVAIITLVPVMILTFFILRHTYSRGAFMGLGVAFIFFTMLLPVKLKYKIIFAVSIALFTILAIRSDIAERSLASMDVRFDYYISAFKMFLNHPWAGTGWGDFFHEYTRIKTFPGSEAPHTPHNVVMSFASQAGVAGLVASVTVLILPFFVFFRKRQSTLAGEVGNGEKKTDWLNIAIIVGWSGWALHSLVDFNFKIPGSAATAITMLLIMNVSQLNKSKESDSASKNRLFLLLWYVAGVGVAVSAMLFSQHQLRFEASLSRLIKNAGLSAAHLDKVERLSDSQLEFMVNRCSRFAPYSPVPWMNAANYAEQHHQWIKAEMYLAEALKRSPERASLYARTAEVQKKSGKDFEAAKNMRRAAELFPNAYKKRLNDMMREFEGY